MNLGNFSTRTDILDTDYIVGHRGTAHVGLVRPESRWTGTTLRSWIGKDYPLIVATMAALKATVTTALVTGRSVLVLAYATAGDGGGGWFRFNSASSASDDLGTIIAPNAGTGRWFRVYDGALNPLWFGANYGADDTTALQAALTACPAYGEVYLPKGTFNTLALTIGTDYITLSGPGKLKAKAAANFPIVLSGTGRTGVTIRDIEIDANGSNRSGVQTTPFGALAFPTSTDCRFEHITARNSRGYSSVSATCMSSSGSTRTRFVDCSVIDCGGDPVTEPTIPSDGIFLRGTNCSISNCYAYKCTDTAFVLEGCDYSSINNCRAFKCTSLGAISNDVTADCVGNTINGLQGSCSYVGSTGGVITVACSGIGNLRDTTISNVTVRIETTATNLGPGMQVRHTGAGRVIGLTINHPTIDHGGNAGCMAQGILVEDSDYVQINNPAITNDTTAGSRCIAFTPGLFAAGKCVGGRVTGGTLIGGDIGFIAVGTAGNVTDVLVQGVEMLGSTTYGLVADAYSTVNSIYNTITSSGTAQFKSLTGATLNEIHYPSWTTWTPTYSGVGGGAGNAATTFVGGAGGVTTTLARYTVQGKIAFVTIGFSAVLNAVTPDTIVLTLPPGVAPQNSGLYTPAQVINDLTYECGFARPIATTNLIQFKRAQLGAWGSGKAVEGHVSMMFEIL